jgi:hypothetical protein
MLLSTSTASTNDQTKLQTLQGPRWAMAEIISVELFPLPCHKCLLHGLLTPYFSNS